MCLKLVSQDMSLVASVRSLYCTIASAGHSRLTANRRVPFTLQKCASSSVSKRDAYCFSALSSWRLAGPHPRTCLGQRGFSTSSSRRVEYVQGQSPGPKLREYFYYIDHQGMLFLDDARMKNFTSCFKDRKFLRFFFDRLRLNESSQYPEFPYVSLCGREMNYVRCDDLPVVYTQLLPPASDTDDFSLRFNHGDDGMVVPFMPAKVIMEPATGRVYHPAPPKLHRAAPVALVHTKIALQLSTHFQFSEGEDSTPSHLDWQGAAVTLDYELLASLQSMAAIRRYSLGASPD